MSPECIGSQYTSSYYSPQYNDILVSGSHPRQPCHRVLSLDSAEWEDPLFRAYLGDPNSIAKTMPIRISVECNELLQFIFQVDPLRRIPLSRLGMLVEQVETFFLEPRIELPLPPPSCRNSGGGSMLMNIDIAGISPPDSSLGMGVRLPPMNVADRDIFLWWVLGASDAQNMALATVGINILPSWLGSISGSGGMSTSFWLGKYIGYMRVHSRIWGTNCGNSGALGTGGILPLGRRSGSADILKVAWQTTLN
ncbi:hypothetical protein CPB85DRAFT_1450632 [Mucidula mucida]|nr:hypothetical protein CPB85DRAFT_1450632 [Mucidula mucida]